MGKMDTNNALTMENIPIPKLKNTEREEACLVIIKGKNENEKFLLSDKHDYQPSTFKIGRNLDSNDYVVPDHKVSRQHFQIIYMKKKYYLVDQGSSNGTLLNGEPVKKKELLKNQDRIQIGDTIIKFLQGDIENQFLDNLRDRINKDSMTDTFNRQFLITYLERKMAETLRNSYTFSVVALDIDHFKNINDTYGHQAGDLVLILLCKIIMKRIRNSDILARMGGEEFNIYFPDTGIKDAVQVAENLRKMIEKYKFMYQNKKIIVTVSMGVVEYTPQYNTVNHMLKAADDLLYQAKTSGRNRVIGI